MFELLVAKKYLIPKRKQLSVALIAMMSIVVISLVVWLLLIFLSVTEGIEKNWLQKLTGVHAPIRITPTEEYYSSYYYQIDQFSSSSNYSSKSITEKNSAATPDPYLAGQDIPLPSLFPNPDLDESGQVRDLVKSAFSAIEEIKIPLIAQEFETCGALIRLELLRSRNAFESTHQYLTQVSYLTSLPSKNPRLKNILVPPTKEDIQHLALLAEKNPERDLNSLLEFINLQEIKTKSSHPRISASFLPEKTPFYCKATLENGLISSLTFPRHVKNHLTNDIGDHTAVDGEVEKREGRLFVKLKGSTVELPLETPLFLDHALRCSTKSFLHSEQAQRRDEVSFPFKIPFQNAALEGALSWKDVDFLNFSLIHSPSHEKSTPYWIYQKGAEFELPHHEGHGILLAKSFQEQGVLIGDRGYFSYPAASTSSLTEQHIPIFVAGFYDPGVIGIGGKVILVPPFIAHAINGSGSSYTIDKNLANGIHVWFDDLSKTDLVKEEIQKAFSAKGIAPYWKVTSYKEFDFVKDLLQQFQSDKYLFSLVGVIILLVACCNVISLLVLLVNDKKREIAILQSMGASSMSIALIFGLAGFLVGVLSTLFGTFLAMITLKNIDSIIGMLSFLQGHDAFNALFFGKSLSSSLSSSSLKFIFITTPLLSLLAGLIPAIKACKLKPAEILRSE